MCSWAIGRKCSKAWMRLKRAPIQWDSVPSRQSCQWTTLRMCSWSTRSLERRRVNRRPDQSSQTVCWGTSAAPHTIGFREFSTKSAHQKSDLVVGQSTEPSNAFGIRGHCRISVCPDGRKLIRSPGPRLVVVIERFCKRLTYTSLGCDNQ